MIDFHTHLLPKMDDGSKSVEESCKMLNELASQGVIRVAATPHFSANAESLEHFVERRKKSFELLKLSLSDLMPQILLGAEVKYYQGISRLENLRDLCLEKTNFLLLEMPMCKWTEYILKEVTDISSSLGINVVLAHVERFIPYQPKETIERLLDSGVYFQVNAEFFTRPLTRRKAFKMIKNHQIAFLGSDCHNLTDRSPDIGEALRLIEKKFGKSFVIRFNENAENLMG